ncbi:putative Protein YIPF1 [Hypsibius exemplaris]|uniref:Yip1 domain-containing protein n=1 Tax=Hypsibius exemplaris TaxID=2072580 RepID=A0A1W0WYR2_HYPEX|nr:putative Protein YIPF1 [Hypsibius exemplaris]
MDNNPFKPSSYENKNVTVDVPGYDFYPSSSTYNQNTNTSSGGFGGAPASSSTQQGYGFGEDPPGEGGNAKSTEESSGDKSILSHPVWTWKFWQSFFDVDTSEVLRRMFFSFAPWPRYLKSESVDVFIGAKPDLYGPFWISSTLVFVIAVLGNLASYFQNYDCPTHIWNYDFHKVTAAAISIFLYVWLVPMLVWTFLWWRNSHGTMKLSGALCLYGYSMSLYIPVSFLWLINIVWLQWLFALTAAALSGFILAYIFWNHLHFNHGALAALTGLTVFFLHLALGFGFVTYFFHYARHDDCTHPALNTTTLAYHSTVQLNDPLNFTQHAVAQQQLGIVNLTLTTDRTNSDRTNSGWTNTTTVSVTVPVTWTATKMVPLNTATATVKPTSPVEWNSTVSVLNLTAPSTVKLAETVHSKQGERKKDGR